VAISATGHVGRRLALPIVLLAIGAGWLVSQSQLVGDLQGPVVARAQTISASKVSTNTQDRYRLAERRDAVADLREHPIAGLGVGVPWSLRYPLPFDATGGHQYVHFAPVWWWFKLGILGLVAYATLLVTTLVTGIRVWRHHPDAPVRAAGLAGGIAAIGIFIVDLAATTIGPDIRTTALFATVLGLLAVANAQSQATRDGTLRA
jgi:O-antigen ligase